MIAAAMSRTRDGGVARVVPRKAAVIDHRLPFPSLYAGFQAAARRRPDQVVIRDDGRDTSYRELEQASRLAARALIALGQRAGDRIGIWAVNHRDWIVAGLAN